VNGQKCRFVGGGGSTGQKQRSLTTFMSPYDILSLFTNGRTMRLESKGAGSGVMQYCIKQGLCTV